MPGGQRWFRAGEKNFRGAAAPLLPAPMPEKIFCTFRENSYQRLWLVSPQFDTQLGNIQSGHTIGNKFDINKLEQIYYNFTLLNNFMVTLLLAYQTYLIVAEEYCGGWGDEAPQPLIWQK